MYTFDRQQYEKRIRWFTEARFGMFIHFGLYSVPARGEWVRSYEEMTAEDYQPYFDTFNPRKLDPRAWARAAREAGMQYMVLTAKHHDGFCLFDSVWTDYKSTNTPCRRDIVREYVEAARAEGLKVGLYYSLLDWHHPDYPHYKDRYHPLRNDPSQSNEGRNWDNYITYCHNQVRELCTNYGKIDLLWFDFSYDDMRGEKWRAAELADMVRSLQPGILINNRLEASGEGFGSLAECRPTPYHGDFITPERIIPPDGLKDAEGRSLCWESCITMNNSWGFTANDHAWKSASLLIRKLVECVSKGGNMILNVGPDGDGAFPQEAQQILRQIGQWMSKNGESVIGCGQAGLPKPEWGRYTRNQDHLYLHILENTLGPLPVRDVPAEKLVSARLTADGSQVPVSDSWTHSDYPDILFLDVPNEPDLPDLTDTVAELTLR